MLNFDSTICTNFSEATSREWLETNGIGGYASGTISGAPTRRYHALLTAALRPPLGRVSMMAKFEETLIVSGERFELSANQYPGNIYPRGFELLVSFRLDPFPVWTYETGGIKLEKRLFMVYGANTTVIRWKALLPPDGRATDVSLELRPLVSFVDYHSLQRSDSGALFDCREHPGFVEITSSDQATPLFLFHSGKVERSGFWYRNFELVIERERGFDYTTDLFQPFVLSLDLATENDVIISTNRTTPLTAAKLEKAELARRSELSNRASANTEFEQQLVQAADQFIVARGSGHTIIAGYPWFSDWGRDTMISLPGLTLATNRPEIARGILIEFSRYISDGMLPNRFPDAGAEAEYNTVDATLWYFEAARAYVAKTDDYPLIENELYEKLASIVACHLRGTRYKIHVDTDGLLYSGEPGIQLTWMDAKVGDDVVTPRTGKAVEIQALWYNALRIMEAFAERFGHDDDRKRFASMADLASLSFNSLFWNGDENCLFDVVENGNRDDSIRPNQIFAVSLFYSMLDLPRSRAVVERVESELLTEFGLRSLSPSDPRYVPNYLGPPIKRDSAYHQGTVWAWLIGGYIDSLRRVNGRSVETEQRIASILNGFQPHLSKAGVGQVSEIFDASAPHAPRGCPAQAWSVAELLRALKSA